MGEGRGRGMDGKGKAKREKEADIGNEGKREREIWKNNISSQEDKEMKSGWRGGRRRGGRGEDYVKQVRMW